MIQRLSFLLSCLIPLLGALINKSRYNAFKKEDGGFVFVRRGEALDIPDLDTLKELGFDKDNVTVISNAVLNIMKKGEPIPSLKYANQWPDEMMRVKADTIVAFDPAHYWTEAHFLVGHGTFPRSYNPAMVKIRKDKILYCWRSTDYDSQVLFGWYHHHNHTIVPDPSIKLPNDAMINGFTSPMQDDARLIMLNSTSIIVTFSGVFDKQIYQMYAIGTYNDEAGSVVFRNGSNYMFKYGSHHEKNWIPFVHNDRLLFYRSMSPVHVVQIARTLPNTDKDRNVQEVETVSELPEDTNLPWDVNVYGRVRGGTPTIMLRGKRFALFHTQATVVSGYYTYFMGAISFCPEPPFAIHTISPVPIFRKNLYEGAWDTKKINYVLYPMGIVENEKEGVLHVSVGYQDKNGYMIKLKVDELLETMDVVHRCNSTSGDASHRKLRRN